MHRKAFEASFDLVTEKFLKTTEETRIVGHRISRIHSLSPMTKGLHVLRVSSCRMFRDMTHEFFCLEHNDVFFFLNFMNRIFIKNIFYKYSIDESCLYNMLFVSYLVYSYLYIIN